MAVQASAGPRAETARSAASKPASIAAHVAAAQRGDVSGS